MSWSQTAWDNTRRTLRRVHLHPFRAIKRYLPHRLFGRSLIILVAPMLILQAVVTVVFFDRHYRVVTATITRSVADEIGYMVRLENGVFPRAGRDEQRQSAAESFGFVTEFLPGESLEENIAVAEKLLDRQIAYVLSVVAPPGTRFNTVDLPDTVEVSVELSEGLLRVTMPQARVSPADAGIFILWMIGSALFLIALAALFLRNQVRPIERLARAAESFGKGHHLPNFKPYGATEVRRAAHAFIQMRERIERHVQQRTEMLAGVSHDLKTMLTRMRLQLAMMPKDADSEAMLADLAEMEHMVDEYLEFARGEGGEAALETDLAALIRESVQDGARAAADAQIEIIASDDIRIAVKRNALKRCLINLIDNALKYGTRVEVTLKRAGPAAEISVEDNGPGIPEHRREEAFRAFHRLDEARNLQTGGVGLGLAIARDIARAHGGEVILEQSKRGGLRAVIRLPL